jgi:hypothetical protein
MIYKRIIFWCLICPVLLFIVPMGCSSHHANIKYTGKPNNYYCKGNKIKIDTVKDSRGIDDSTWYATVRGGYGNPLKKLYSEKSVADDVRRMIEVALDLRDCKSDSLIEYILLPTIYELSGNYYFNKEVVFRLSYVIKKIDGSIIYENQINKNIKEGGLGAGIFANVEDFKGFIDGVISDGVDEMVDDPKMWDSLRNYRKVTPMKNENVKERLLLLEELRMNKVISEKEYETKKKEILDSF